MAELSRKGLLWQAFGSSVVGGKHYHQSVPKQDAMHWMPVSGRGRQVVLAIADGHGSEPFFRSAKGANFAVHTTVDAFREFFESHGKSRGEAEVRRWVEKDLPLMIVERWRDVVSEDLEKYPLSDKEERAPLGELAGKAESSFLRYGTTLSVVAVIHHFVMGLQIGRGDMIAISTEGEYTRLMSSTDPTGDGLRDSLCRRDAESLFRTVLFPLQATPPALLAAASDGYFKSLSSERKFEQLLTGYLDHLRRNGLLATSERLERQLLEFSKAEDSDDLTLGMIYLMQDYHRWHNNRTGA